MSKTVATAVRNALQADATQISTCWKITLVSTSPPTELGFTDYDADLIIGGVTYNASSGYTASAIETVPTLEVGNLEVAGLLDSVYITEEDLFRGVYDGAEFEIFWYLRDAAQSIPLMRGFFGEIKLQDGRFVADLRALTDLLGNNFGEKYTYLCRADFGDARCKMDASAFQISGVVLAAPLDYSSFYMDPDSMDQPETPTFFLTAQLTDFTSDSYTVSGTISPAGYSGTVYAVATLPGDGDPDAGQIIAGQNGAGGAARGTGVALAVTDSYSLTVGGALDSALTYDVHVVFETLEV